ncbi:ABC transporter ATP-binding protein [Enterocloster lavalensis]|uniref:ABC transporter ATP-binding protein n=1 Tax=Enterocloster lavalensis TaxID=460384 RepID=UPI001D07A7F2|nr:dipeptide ABC transporter ATP-binding protein [Enterocloster lavalensis]MCB6342632.1 dipeptide ABC transporter ATP-binding protein [Enterocloster lavalensis]
MGTLLEVRNLKKYFQVPKGYLHAVDDVSFKINEGETLGIVGESGCGKSTLGRAILRLHEPTSGTVLYDGMNVTGMDKQEMRALRKYMQIIFQDPYASLNPRFTVAQIIEEPLRLHKIYSSEAEVHARVEELMDMVGLSARMQNAYPHEFDGGRRQRIVIARALAVGPKFIVCDEPVSALDVSIQAQILNLMIDLQKELNLTYIFISHNLSVVKHISTDVGVMYLGQLIEKAPKRMIYKNPLHPYTIALLAAIPSLDPEAKRERQILKGELTSPVNPKRGCRFSTRCPFAQDRCFTDNPVMREVEPGHFVACHRVLGKEGIQ